MVTLAVDQAGDSSNRTRVAEEYLQAVRSVFVIAHIWGSPGKETPPNGTDGDAPSPRAEVELVCLQANNLGGESVDAGPDDDEDGGEDGDGDGNQLGPDQGSPSLGVSAQTGYFGLLVSVLAGMSLVVW